MDMSYLLILGLLVLIVKWGFRNLLKRALLMVAVPVLHVHYLRQSENPLAFQGWTLVGVAALLLWTGVRVYRYLRSLRS
jgi:hypothetical protein